MNDRLNLAIKLLREHEASCVILQDGKPPFVSADIGIKPLMMNLRENKQAFQGGVIADKVVGKAAALMALLGGATSIYGEVMSEEAQKVLQIGGIEYEYDVLVPYIQNRTKTGRCPMEETVLDIEEPEIAFEELEKTILRLMAQK